ncbi:MAG TPA: cupin domain-containing protein [Candidatus Dormibacteraeota bacterium]|nr:cupin domain-containing protein [Candidatus Dormibacteraeota bacterium]
MKTQTFSPLAELRPYAIWNGVTARVANGDRMTLASVDLGPNVAVPEHHHENEQLGIVVHGTLRFTIGDESRELGPGDTYVIPSNVPHHVVAGPEGCTVIDVFAPTRADWEKLPRREPSPPDWPG